MRRRGMRPRPRRRISFFRIKEPYRGYLLRLILRTILLIIYLSRTLTPRSRAYPNGEGFPLFIEIYIYIL